MRNTNLATRLTKEMLEYEYKTCGSIRQMAIKLNISIDSISKYMKLQDVNYTNGGRIIYTCNHDIFKTDTETSFYLAGFIAADGSVQNRKHSSILKIALGIKDLNHLTNIKNLFVATNPIHQYLNVKHPYAELAIVSKTICQDLKRFNIVQNKTFLLTMPKWLKRHPLVHHFIRGYIDGDGCWGIGKTSGKRTVRQVGMSILGTFDMMSNFKTIIENKSGTSSITGVGLRSNKKTFVICYNGNQMCSKIFDFIYKDATIYLDRKYQIAKQAGELKSTNGNFARHTII